MYYKYKYNISWCNLSLLYQKLGRFENKYSTHKYNYKSNVLQIQLQTWYKYNTYVYQLMQSLFSIKSLEGLKRPGRIYCIALTLTFNPRQLSNLKTELQNIKYLSRTCPLQKIGRFWWFFLVKFTLTFNPSQLSNPKAELQNVRDLCAKIWQIWVIFLGEKKSVLSNFWEGLHNLWKLLCQSSIFW